MVVAYGLSALALEGSRLSCLTGWYVLGNYGSKLRESLSSEKPETQVDSGMFEFASQELLTPFSIGFKGIYFYTCMNENCLSCLR